MYMFSLFHLFNIDPALSPDLLGVTIGDRLRVTQAPWAAFF